MRPEREGTKPARVRIPMVPAITILSHRPPSKRKKAEAEGRTTIPAPAVEPTMATKSRNIGTGVGDATENGIDPPTMAKATTQTT